MADSTNTLTAIAIVFLAFQEFIESGAEELAKKSTGKVIAKINDLRKVIWDEMRGKPTAEAALTLIETGSKAEFDRLVAYLQVAMDDDPHFADDIRLLAQEIYVGKIQDNSSMNQNNYDNSTGWQTKVEGGTAYVGEIPRYDLRSANVGNFASQIYTKAEQITEEAKSGVKISALPLIW